MSLENYKSLKDFEQIKQFLEPDPVDFEPQINIPPFEPG